jgi:hypothetical protein
LKSVIDSTQHNHEETETKTDQVQTIADKHTSIKDLLDCPNCYNEIAPEVVKREMKDANFECTDCHTPVKGEKSEKEDWLCPTCGNKYARERSF